MIAKTNRLVTLATCLIAFGLLASCSKAPQNKAQIRVAFWGSPEEKQIILDSVKPWQEAHPEIDLIMEHTPAGGYVQKMLTRIAGGTPPDIFCIRVDQFVTFAAKNILLDLSPYIANDTVFRIEDYFPEVIANFSSADKVLALPRDIAPYACIFYNKTIFDERGVPYPTDDWTWADLLEKAKALSWEDDHGRRHYGYYGWAWENFVYSNGGSLVDDVKNPTRTELNQPQAVEALQFYADLINVHQVMPTPVALANLGMGVDMMFADGYIAMFQSGIWETPALRKYPDLKWDVVMFPKGNSGIRKFGTGGSAYGILASTKYPKESWDVLKLLAGPAGQAELAQQGLAQPAIRAIAEGNDWATSSLPPKNKSMLNEAIQHITFDPLHERWAEVRAKYIIPELELLFNGKQNAATAVSKFVDNVNALLSEK